MAKLLEEALIQHQEFRILVRLPSLGTNWRNCTISSQQTHVNYLSIKTTTDWTNIYPFPLEKLCYHDKQMKEDSFLI